jgi:hypothetical protein
MISLCPPDVVMYAKLDYFQFLEEIMHFQLSNFHSVKTFRYQSHLVYLILSNNVSHFENLGIQLVSDSGTHKVVIDWTVEVRRQYQNKGFLNFVNKFMSSFYILLHSTPPPRMFPKFKKML